MNNFLINFNAVSILLLSLPSVSYADAIHQSQSCIENVSGYLVVKVDSLNHRFFAIQQEKNKKNKQELLTKFSECFINTPWEGDWNISLFSEKKFAGYKDQNDIIPYHKGNQWAAAYLAEFSSNSMVKYPAYEK